MAEIEVLAEGAKRIHCVNCGAELAYKPGTTTLVCGYCDTRNEINQAEMEVAEHDLLEFLRESAAKADTREVETIECNSCGGIATFDPSLVAQSCGFCGNHLLVKDAVKVTNINPHAVLPFQIDRKAALKLYKEWLNSRWFAPNDLKKMQNHPNTIQGIYIPYWTFDAETASDYTGERGVHRTETYTVSVTRDGKPATETRTRVVTDWYPASGHVDHFFDDVLVLASKSLPEKQAHRLSPWNLSQLVVFEEDYLRGFKVESYRVTLEEGFTTGKQLMEEDIRVLVRQDIGGNEQRIHSLHTDYDDLKFKHILLPIWISSFKFKGKTFQFLVNGQTGEVQGERPYSAAKIALLVIAIIAVIVLIIFLFQMGEKA
ncbi:MAG: DNA helicase PriA [Flavobacteriales bacterium]|nr:DNA helicase PriA [Flavobacteriales bacterium]